MPPAKSISCSFDEGEMSISKKNLLVCAVLFVTTAAIAQRSPSPALNQSGLYEYTTLGAGHDSSAGWSSVMNSAVGYSFTPAVSIEAGIPFYLVTTTQALSTTGATSTTHAGSLGDVFLNLNAHKDSSAINYATGLTFTAPTGDTSTGVSTGRATATWNNRLEHGFDHLTPFGEASLGNSLTSTRRYRRDYTTLGAVSEFRGGVGIDLLKNLGLETSAFADVGYGNQKIFSRTVRKGALGVAGVPKHNRAFDTAYLTTGTASLVNDNGLTADLSWNPTARLNFDLAYNHSLHFATDSVSAGIGFRLGHVAAKPR